MTTQALTAQIAAFLAERPALVPLIPRYLALAEARLSGVEMVCHH